MPAGLVQRGEGCHVHTGAGGGWCGGPGTGGNHLIHHHLGVAPTEGNLPAVQLPQEDAQTVHVAVGGGVLASQELRRLVAGRPHQAVVHPQAEVIEGDGTSEVSELADSFPGDEDVGWLDVQVDDALAVAVREGEGHLVAGLHQPAPTQHFVLQLHQQPVEVPAADVLHDDHRVTEQTTRHQPGRAGRDHLSS